MLAGVPFIPRIDVPFDASHPRVWTIVLTGDATPRSGRPHRPRGHRAGRWPHRAATFTSPRAARPLEKASRLAPVGQMITVVTRRWASVWKQELDMLPHGPCVVQPTYRGRAAELLLPLLKLTRRDPAATVIALPAGHRLEHDARLSRYVGQAVWAVALRPDVPLIIGSPPDSPEADGWIEPAAPVEGLEGLGVRTVRQFIDGASPAERRELFDHHAIVSTSILVARADTLLALAGRVLPDVLEALEPLEDVFDRPEESLLCEAIYECMPQVGLRALERAPELAVLALPDAVWRAPEHERLELLAA
jgi:mannose-1-phosphate guanylyltransferase